MMIFGGTYYLFICLFAIIQLIWVKKTKNDKITISQGYYLLHSSEICLLGVKNNSNRKLKVNKVFYPSSFLPPFLYTPLPFYLPSFLPPFLYTPLPFYLPSFLPLFLFTPLPFYLPSFLPLFLNKKYMRLTKGK